VITRIQARNYKCLKDVDVSLSPFQVLVGANGSGKSTFMDVLGFIRDMLLEHDGLNAAVEKRARSLSELTWNGEGGAIDFAVEVGRRDEEAEGGRIATWRYALTCAHDEDAGGLAIASERLMVDASSEAASASAGVAGTASDNTAGAWRDVFRRQGELGVIGTSGEDVSAAFPLIPPYRSHFHDAVYAAASRSEGAEVLGSILHVHGILSLHAGIFTVNSGAMRTPCRPDARKTLEDDGSNVAKVVATLKEDDPTSYKDWIQHLRTVLADLKDIIVVEQEHDRHLYIKMLRTGRPPTPAWLMSDGELRLLALTLLAYAPATEAVVLVEEPEDGVHPQAIEAVFDSLRSIHQSQVLLATHSPLMVGLAAPEQLVCLAQTDEGGTRMVRGDQHPRMKHWRRETDLGTLYASGILDGDG